MKGLLKEFKEFAVRGNALDLAVAVVVGGAFGKIISSLVADIITPLLGFATGGVDFKKLTLTLREAHDALPAIMLTYGAFLQTLFDFIIVATALFVVLKLINTVRKRFEREKSTASPTEKPYQERLLEEIRDLLKTGRQGS